MKSVKLKVNNASGMATLAHPFAKPGRAEGSPVAIKEIVEIPDDVHVAKVLKLFDRTTDVTYLRQERFVFHYSELGEGVILMDKHKGPSAASEAWASLASSGVDAVAEEAVASKDPAKINAARQRLFEERRHFVREGDAMPFAGRRVLEKQIADAGALLK
jgi:hypothetical protein